MSTFTTSTRLPRIFTNSCLRRKQNGWVVLEKDKWKIGEIRTTCPVSSDFMFLCVTLSKMMLYFFTLSVCIASTLVYHPWIIYSRFEPGMFLEFFKVDYDASIPTNNLISITRNVRRHHLWFQLFILYSY